jgi:exodeoxyribonuclease X
MRAAVLDTETTGDAEEDQVVEVAVVELELPSGKELSRWRSFVMPDVHVKPEARGAHHISDDELAGAPSMQEILANGGIPGLTEEDVIPVAHNMSFDARLLRQSGVDVGERVLCTWKLARHLYPHAPNHKNQTLRYWLGIDVVRPRGVPIRAMDDALVTAGIFQHMLERGVAWRRCSSSWTAPSFSRSCNMGEKRGLPWSAQDVGLLRWVLDPKKKFDEDLLYTARYWLDQPRDRQGRLL